MFKSGTDHHRTPRRRKQEIDAQAQRLEFSLFKYISVSFLSFFFVRGRASQVSMISASWSCSPRVSSSFRWLRERDTNSSAFSLSNEPQRRFRGTARSCWPLEDVEKLSDECSVHQTQSDYDTQQKWISRCR